MKSLIGTIILLFSLHATPAYAQNITQQQIKTMLDAVSTAANQRDANAIASLLSDNVRIKILISFNGRQTLNTPNKQQYLVMLKQTWNSLQSYSYQRQNTTVYMQGKSAKITADIIESMSHNGQSITTKAKEQAVIELVNGKLLITKVSIQAQM